LVIASSLFTLLCCAEASHTTRIALVTSLSVKVLVPLAVVGGWTYSLSCRLLRSGGSLERVKDYIAPAVILAVLITIPVVICYLLLSGFVWGVILPPMYMLSFLVTPLPALTGVFIGMALAGRKARRMFSSGQWEMPRDKALDDDGSE
jgi:hypothetical protein